MILLRHRFCRSVAGRVCSAMSSRKCTSHSLSMLATAGSLSNHVRHHGTASMCVQRGGCGGDSCEADAVRVSRNVARSITFRAFAFLLMLILISHHLRFRLHRQVRSFMM